LSLILIEPHEIRQNLINNFSGIRIDGSNATIIGDRPGEFIADRNAIARVWMDHGVWPLSTILLYIHQTGDFDILLKDLSYFKDSQFSRTAGRDAQWNQSYGNQLKTVNGEIYFGSIAEHLLVQNLVQFFNVGEHNIIRLEGADWNDGLDMANDRGESVAFSSYYAGNLLSLADLFEELGNKKLLKSLKLAKELRILLDTISDRPCEYESVEAKKLKLYDEFFKAVQPELTGDTEDIAIASIVKDLRAKGQWLFRHIKTQEKISVDNNMWFNGYYDNKGNRVEGQINGRIRMTLTGQVFPILSGLADNDEIEEIVKSVQVYLKDSELGGVRLNSNFGVDHYLEFGRAFGFAYGTKENGSFFSHMSVMYAYALYKRNFAKEGFEVLNAIYKMSADANRSKIFPGVPEYIDSLGKGMYHYLTGSASWYVLAMVTQVFGVRGHYGNLLLNPKLVKGQFDANGIAAIACYFAGTRLEVDYENVKKLECGEYSIKEIFLDNQPIAFEYLDEKTVLIERSLIMSDHGTCGLKVILS